MHYIKRVNRVELNGTTLEALLRPTISGLVKYILEQNFSITAEQWDGTHTQILTLPKRIRCTLIVQLRLG